MFIIDYLILLASILLLAGIVSSKLSARMGIPVLVLFLLVGMAAGEEGLGGIAFDNAAAAHALGTLALAMILFDGGLQTPLSSIRLVWKPAATLATAGVLITALITGLTAAYMLDLPLLQGLLLGSIVGSTDAAAVFSQLRNAGIHLKEKLKATLEIESASNDPMAIFLTVGLLEILMNDMDSGMALIILFISQMGIGALIGLSFGWLAVRLINRIQLAVSGLYPVMVSACGLLTFGVAAYFGGSGFLAIFIAGVVIGNSRFTFQRSTFLFHDGLAWLSQITMFVVLGMLISPSSLLDVWFKGLMIALVLTFVARPLAVLPVAKLFGFNARETALISWVGLRGSVPIILAIFPLVFGLPGAELIFNIVFFVVLISATVQGFTLPWVANKLGLTESPPSVPGATLEITAFNEVDTDLVLYTLGNESKGIGRRLSRMALPEGVVVAMITRGQTTIPPRGSTLLHDNDHLFILLKSHTREFVDIVFSSTEETPPVRNPDNELRLKGTAQVGDVTFSYGLQLDGDDDASLEDVIRNALLTPAEEGASVTLNDVTLYIREMVGTRIATVGIKTTAPAVEHTQSS